MGKSKRSSKLKDWFENHPFWVVLSIASFLLTLTIAVGTVFSFTTNFIDNNILWKNAEQLKIDTLAPTQTTRYFNSVLGEPNIKTVQDELTRYVYKERGYWVEAFSDKDDVIQIFTITACGEESFYPKIKNNPVGNELILGKTKMKNVTELNPIKSYYFLRGASAPSYYYDEYYGGNPSNYQTLYAGHNELCGYLKLPQDINDNLYAQPIGTNKLNDEQILRLRTNTMINTIGVTSPSFNLKKERLINIGDGGLGVSYVDEGVLMPNQEFIDDEDVIKNYQDFDVIRFN